MTRSTAPEAGAGQAGGAVRLTMPIPPSLNALMSGKLSDRIVHKNAAQWAALLAWQDAGQPVFIGPVLVDARFYFPDRRRRDRENYGAAVKSAIDLLVQRGCIERDDSEYFDMQVFMLLDTDNPRLELWIREGGTNANPR